ncbi:fatty acid desaturase family protein [Actinomycetospora termitidis]|uniref:Acyl-CoA desaturase n=1 Tax=Actinomycetospora termitidis TaxID=3053470 RepID=A0ABT7MB94_9PSEU|nr:acyl-CoA desaturase [Actinomycetospora sp. Odt1-22]MDL5156688.1 acyl-CoA desaturase [Actinomycetospora sp. Odt1-22]
MAISDIKEFAHLTEADVEALGEEFDAIRRDVEASRGAADEEYIRGIIKTQRRIEIAGRAALFGSVVPPLWMAGAALLGVAKILENMEIGHNVMHGQWDWMNDPEIHSATWEWDNVCPAEQWKHSHNYLHHTYTNVLGKDKDVGYEILRVTSDQKWHPVNLGQPVFNTLLMLLFQHGVAIHDLDIEGLLRRDIQDPEEFKAKLEQVGRKMRKQMGKDYILFPLLTGPFFLTTLTANMTANLIRNVWSYAIIFCGHFPDGAEVFTEEQLENETQGEWYLRQLLGSANFTGNRLMHVMSGSLGYQIEHHLFPDLPSNRYPEIAERVKEICAKYDLPYNIGPFPKQFWKSIRTIWRLALPNKKFAAEQAAHESEGLRRENASSTPSAEADVRVAA